jgi:hypothetical protein
MSRDDRCRQVSGGIITNPDAGGWIRKRTIWNSRTGDRRRGGFIPADRFGATGRRGGRWDGRGRGQIEGATAVWRLARGLWSLGWLTVLLAGIPAALVYYVGWPLPDHWPARPELEQWVAQPVTRPAIIGTAAVLIWLLWALLVYAVVVEVLVRVRRAVRALRRLRLPPLPTPMQATASGVLGAAVFGLPTGTTAPAPPVKGAARRVGYSVGDAVVPPGACDVVSG